MKNAVFSKVLSFATKGATKGSHVGSRHIRTHMKHDSFAETEEESADMPINRLISTANPRNIKRFVVSDAGGQSAAYGLRENPKKTKRFSDSGNGSSLKEMLVCKECGKGFRSLKALCGHMSCHSDNGERQKVIMDSQSDTETSAPCKRRSRRGTPKTIGVYRNNNSENLGNGSSSVSEIVQEQEEVAMCLMMLSRDSGCRKRMNSAADSSDNNSVVLEDKSSSIDMTITIKNDMNRGGFLKMTKQRDNKLKKSPESDPSSENSDSGYFRNGPKKVESDDSVDGFLKNNEFKKPNIESGSGFRDRDATYSKCLSKFKSVKTGSPKYGLRRNGKNDYYSPQKGSKYECLTCNKTFDSHRALGGHRASHTKVNGYNESLQESYENNLANDSFTAPMTDTKVTKASSNGRRLGVPRGSSYNAEKRLGSKKNKGHECPFCFRVFKSGQALGGHKRSHFVGGSDDRTLVIKQDSSDMPALIDLNLPAPVEEDAFGNAAGFMP
ncbi:hypothetical protein Goshw_016128 [Gossypium schwendimanii]|uniref:C2H2-type domain-containing protein n=1 Tax=Gossypium schwendimanii TaxID=34291 RepID=A0A7J9LW89_GOSSC|nr:hypothetical protein [Gossypium schwendimanii]